MALKEKLDWQLEFLGLMLRSQVKRVFIQHSGSKIINESRCDCRELKKEEKRESSQKRTVYRVVVKMLRFSKINESSVTYERTASVKRRIQKPIQRALRKSK